MCFRSDSSSTRRRVALRAVVSALLLLRLLLFIPPVPQGGRLQHLGPLRQQGGTTAIDAIRSHLTKTVPSFTEVNPSVRGGSAIVEGLGERLSHAPLPADAHAVLLLPDVACPTGPVYRAFDALRADAALQPDRVRQLAMRGVAPEADEPFNDLADPALEVAPRLRGEREEVAELVGRPVHVSGSGSTLFFMVNGPVEGDLLADAVTRHTGMPALPVRVVPTPAPTWVRRARD